MYENIPNVPSMVRAWDAAAERRNTASAERRMADEWVTGAGGTEVPMLRNGRWQLYVWNPALREHGWLDIATDTVETA